MTPPRPLTPTPRRRIKGGIVCNTCGFERFKFKPACPACEDKVLRSLDTSTNILSGRLKEEEEK